MCVCVCVCVCVCDVGEFFGRRHHSIAIPIPVLPLEASTTVCPGLSLPFCSAHSIKPSASRSLNELMGLKASHLTKTSMSFGAILLERMSGVLPNIEKEREREHGFVLQGRRRVHTCPAPVLALRLPLPLPPHPITTAPRTLEGSKHVKLCQLHVLVRGPRSCLSVRLLQGPPDLCLSECVCVCERERERERERALLGTFHNGGV